MNNLNEHSSNSAYTSYVLKAIDLYNWGPFNGRHHVDIHPEGTAIIGPTGSGKTTVIDALMTLLVALPRYNLASTGGHDSDRDLMSYIRGVSGAGNDSGDNRHVARTGKTITGISATFSQGEATIELGTLLWIDSTSSNNADRKDLWLASENPEQSLDQWLLAHRDGGSRSLKQLGKEELKLKVFDTKKSYLAYIRRFFDVGANAFTLLNRAAGLKQLNSIDEIFREYVLDDHAAYDRAAEVASEFDDLKIIYTELETARTQQQSLLPINATHDQFAALQEKLSFVNQVLKALPIWFAITAQRLWSNRQAALMEALNLLQARITDAVRLQEEKARFTDVCHKHYLELGGDAIDRVKDQISQQLGALQKTQENVRAYQALATTLKLDPATTRRDFERTQQIAQQKQPELEASRLANEKNLHELGATRVQQQRELDAVIEELSTVEQNPDSNIPGPYVSFRKALADELGIEAAAIPYVAELVETQASFSEWRGAIERAIGGHRLRLLVPEEQTRQALRWVNQRNNQLNVKILDAIAPQQPPRFMEDGFVTRLNFKPHALREPMKALLASIDRHCVDDSDTLHNTPHSLTKEGLMSGASGRFEKMDQRDLAQGWVTGFSNKDQLANLSQQKIIHQQAVNESDRAFDEQNQRLRLCDNQLQQLATLQEITFDSIDVESEQRALDALQHQLDILSAPDSDAGKAKRVFEQARADQRQAEATVQELREARATLKEKLAHVDSQVQATSRRAGEGLPVEEMTQYNALFPTPADEDVDQLNDLERTARDQQEAKQNKVRDDLERVTQRLVRQMENAKKVDTGALNEAHTELIDVPAYLERLRVLTEEALPEKLNRFQTYLNLSSDQGVTQLLTEIDNEVSAIVERIEELNYTLQRVDFQEHRFLRLVPRRVTHESLRTLERARTQLRSATLRDDQGESQYQALQNIVQILREASDNRRTNASRALLDPRYRIQFSYSVIDRHTGETIETRTGSQGGSGGEKEIIASYILTASLSYALCPAGFSQPLFGTVVLDEAFSKSSQVVAGRIISALKAFGLHPLFVTPNKEMRLLREHTRSAILVHRKGLNATLTSVSWETIEAHAKTRLTQNRENA